MGDVDDAALTPQQKHEKELNELAEKLSMAARLYVQIPGKAFNAIYELQPDRSYARTGGNMRKGEVFDRLYGKAIPTTEES